MTFWAAGAVVVGSLISSNSASDAASTAAEASGRASDASVGEQRRQFDINQANQQPFLTAGTSAVKRLGTGVETGGEFGSYTPFNFQYDPATDPGYGFRMSEGMDALNRSMAAKGLGVSGMGIRGAQAFGQGLAAGSIKDAFDMYTTRYNANNLAQNNLYNRLAGVAGTGQTSANQVGTAGANMASNIGNAYMTSAANTGNAAMSAAGIRNSAYGGAANVLGRLYGNYGQNQYATGQQLSNQYGSSNVYGAGGGGTNYLSGPGASYMPIGE
jgi:hypothetical protein